MVSASFRDSVGYYHNQAIRHWRKMSLPHTDLHSLRFITVKGEQHLMRDALNDAENAIVDYCVSINFDTTIARIEINKVYDLYNDLGLFGIDSNAIEYMKIYNLSDVVLERYNDNDLSTFENSFLSSFSQEIDGNQNVSIIDSIMNSIPVDSLYLLNEFNLPVSFAIYDSSLALANDFLQIESVITTSTSKSETEKQRAPKEARNRTLESAITAVAGAGADAITSASWIGAALASSGVYMLMEEYWDDQWCKCPECGVEIRCDEIYGDS